jgi:hypothetical protein
VLGVVAGCGRDQSARPAPSIEPLETASSPSPNPTPEKSIACELLTATDRRSVAGEDIKVVVAAPPAKGSEQCRWVKTLKTGAPTMVQVAIAPAQVWAKTVPTQVDGALRAGRADEKLIKKLLAAKKELRGGADKISDKRACEMFSLLAETQGRKPGVTETISFPPFGTQLAAQARVCAKGIYATVTYSELGLKPSISLGQAVTRLVKIAHIRATKLGYPD